MIAAIMASRNGNEVILLEKMRSLGRKLSITGKGRCNITNATDIENFIKELKEHKITCLVDVRSSPRSSYYKDFDSDVLESRLKNEGILYRNYAFEFGLPPHTCIILRLPSG